MVQKFFTQLFKKVKNFIFPPLEVEVLRGAREEVEEMFERFLKCNFDAITEVKVRYERTAPILIKGIKQGRKTQVYILWRSFYENTESFRNVIKKHSPNSKIVFV